MPSEGDKAAVLVENIEQQNVRASYIILIEHIESRLNVICDTFATGDKYGRYRNNHDHHLTPIIVINSHANLRIATATAGHHRCGLASTFANGRQQ